MVLCIDFIRKVILILLTYSNKYEFFLILAIVDKNVLIINNY